MDPYIQLAQYLLPGELFSHFELCRVEEINSELHLYLEEKNLSPDSNTSLSPNGFHEESCIRDFPIRNHKVTLHVRRRRWKDAAGKSVSKDWKLVAEGTRRSPEFAAFFLKDCLEKYPITGRSLEKYFHIDGDQFERQYKEHLIFKNDIQQTLHKSRSKDKSGKMV